MGVPITNPRGHTKAWDSESPTRGATPKRGSPYGGHQSGLAGSKPPPLYTRGTSSCSSQGRRQGEPLGASPRPSAPTYLPTYLGVRIPNSRGHAKAWESVSHTQGATPKCGSPYPQLGGPHQSVGLRIPNSRGQAKAWESVCPTQRAIQEPGSPYPQPEGAHQSVAVLIPNPGSHTKTWDSEPPTRGATPKRGSPYHQSKGPHQSVGVRIPNSRGHA